MFTYLEKVTSSAVRTKLDLVQLFMIIAPWETRSLTANQVDRPLAAMFGSAQIAYSRVP